MIKSAGVGRQDGVSVESFLIDLRVWRWKKPKQLMSQEGQWQAGRRRAANQKACWAGL